MGRGRGGKKKKDADSDTWDPVAARARVLKAFTAVCQLNLAIVFSPDTVEEVVLRTMCRAAYDALACKDSMKEKDTKAPAFFVISACAVR